MLFIYETRLASNEIFSPSNKIHREVGRAKDLSAPLYVYILSPIRKETRYSDRRFWVSYILFIIIISEILVLFIYIYIYITRLASNKIFSPWNKIHREVGRAKELSAPLYVYILSPIRKETRYSDRRFWVSYILLIIIIGGILLLFINVASLASNEIFSPSNKIHRKIVRDKDLPAPLYWCSLFWDVTQLSLVVTVVSGKPVCVNFKDQAWIGDWHIFTKRLCLTTNLRCITSLES